MGVQGKMGKQRIVVNGRSMLGDKLFYHIEKCILITSDKSVLSRTLGSKPKKRIFVSN